MKEIRTEDAVGHMICHDITRIIPNGVKEVAFKKGHIVREEDIPELHKVGKRHLYVWDNDGSYTHENDAAEFIYNMISSEYMRPTEVKEGKINVFSEVDGILRVDSDRLLKLNSIGDMALATRHDLNPLSKGDMIAGTRIVPLMIKTHALEKAKEEISGGPILKIHPFKRKKTAIIVTGSEVYDGLIEDGFSPVVKNKVEFYGSEVFEIVKVPDEPEKTTGAILDLVARGAEMVLVTGGMSVDPDDKTPLAIKNTGADIASYGTPVLPGTMFMLAYLNGVPVMGLPGCVMHSERTVFDIILPRVLADIPVSKKDIEALGKGGLCLSCEVCIYPRCGFGAV